MRSFKVKKEGRFINAKILRELPASNWSTIKYTTRHLQDRLYRLKTFTPKSAYEVDLGHKNGNEVHVITTDMDIYIFNKGSRQLITVLRATPRQIGRYGYKMSHTERLEAMRHEKLGLNWK